MRPNFEGIEEAPLNIAGSTVFGRYPIISVEQTYNQILSDGWLVPYAGYKAIVSIGGNQGRGIFTIRSTTVNAMIVVVDDGVYLINSSLFVNKIGNLQTYSGTVYIDQNNANQICISDSSALYIYNFATGSFQTVMPGFIPGYVTFQDGYFITPSIGTNQWRLSALNDGTSWPNDSGHVGLLQGKPDTVVAAVRAPGKGNLLLVFGTTLTEYWYDTGAQLFPYQRNNFSNLDFGCLNPATIATNEKMIAWLAVNEKSGPVIMFSEGGEAKKISTDGIDFQLSRLQAPQDSYGFFFKQDGHTIYQISFTTDNLSYAYDFNTNKFFTVTDPAMAEHPAKQVVFFNNSYYFVNQVDGNVYELSTKYTDGNGNELPRIRVCKEYRTSDNCAHIFKYMGFTIEQGTSSDIPFLQFSMSKNGGQSFSNVITKPLNTTGNYINRLVFWNLGRGNSFTPQFRFYGHGRFVATDGVLGVQ